MPVFLTGNTYSNTGMNKDIIPKLAALNLGQTYVQSTLSYIAEQG